MKNAKQFGMIGAFAALTACASVPDEPVQISEEECLSADWKAVGLVDGLAGYRDRKAAYGKVCGPYGVTVDNEAYTEGRNAGIKAYCTEEGGFIAGERGNPYRGVCDRPAELAFRDGYEQGKLKREIAEAQAELRAIRLESRKLMEQLRVAAYVESSASDSRGSGDPEAEADAQSNLRGAEAFGGSIRERLLRLRERRIELENRLQGLRAKVTVTDID